MQLTDSAIKYMLLGDNNNDTSESLTEFANANFTITFKVIFASQTIKV